MNRHLSKYGNNTITRFDIVGSFFVNLFYNEFFKKANSIKQQSLDKSTTEIFKELVVAYSEFTHREEFFKQAVKGIHAYIISNTNQIDMTHKECIDFIVKEFIPQNIFESLRENQKAKIFHDAIANVVRQFISTIVSKYIKMVIDYRGSPESSTVLQNEFLDIICLEKDKVYGRFISPKSANMIPAEVYKKKMNAVVEVINMKEKELKKKDKIIEALKKVNDKSAFIIKSLQEKITYMSKESKSNSPVARSIIKQATNNKSDNTDSSIDNENSYVNRQRINSDDNSVTSVSSVKSNNSVVSKDEIDKLSIIEKNSEDVSDIDGSSLLYDASDSYY